MILLATEDDIPHIAKGLLYLVETTGWNRFGVTPSLKTLEEWLHGKLLSSGDICIVGTDRFGTVLAFCGATLGEFHCPPHMRTVHEWGWYGPAKLAVHVWNAAKQWGVTRGAVLAGYSKILNTHSKKISECIIWEQLERK